MTKIKLQDIEIGKYYRLKDTCSEFGGYYGFVKPIKKYKKGQWDSPDKSKNLVECEHVVYKTDKSGLIRYFKPARLVEAD